MLVLRQQLENLLAGSAHRCRDERHPGHLLAHLHGGPLRARHETGVAVGDDAEQSTVLVDDGKAGDAEVRAQCVELGECRLWRHRHGVGDHARLRALDLIDLLRLVLDGDVAVDDADAALARHRDRHGRLCDRVHRGGGHRDVQRDPLGQSGRCVRLRRNHVGVPRQEQHIVIRQPDEAEGIVVSHGQHLSCGTRLAWLVTCACCTF